MSARPERADPGASQAGPPARRGRPLLIAAVALAVVGVDQLTKTLAIHSLAPGGRLVCAGPDATVTAPRHAVATLSWYLTCNSGAAFSLGRGVTPVVEVVVVALVAGLLLVGRRAAQGATAAMSVGVGLLLGGAVGNLVDRVARGNGGAVVDFVDAVRVGTHDYWPVFNVADAAIVVGAVVLAVTYGRPRSGS